MSQRWRDTAGSGGGVSRVFVLKGRFSQPGPEGRAAGRRPGLAESALQDENRGKVNHAQWLNWNDFELISAQTKSWAPGCRLSIGCPIAATAAVSGPRFGSSER